MLVYYFVVTCNPARENMEYMRSGRPVCSRDNSRSKRPSLVRYFPALSQFGINGSEFEQTNETLVRP